MFGRTFTRNKIETGKIDGGELAKFGHCRLTSILYFGKDFRLDASAPARIVVKAAATYAKIAYHFGTYNYYPEVHTSVGNPPLNQYGFFRR